MGEVIERRTFVTSDGAEFDSRDPAEEWQGELDVIAALTSCVPSSEDAEDAKAFANLLINAPADKLRVLITALEPYA